MQRKRLPVFAIIAFAAASLAACAQPMAQAAQEESAVTVKSIEGSELSSVTLTEQSAERLGIETARVERSPAGGMVVPYSAVLYDEQGGVWVFTNPEGLTFVRAEISVDGIDGDVARLSNGPPVGTAIATVGVAELFGAEMGVGDPE
ncbi:MAG TPA: hypothetical protein VIL50_02115 [Candidatus Limnocylindrales bacterium]|jgi:hypothetical protein